MPQPHNPPHHGQPGAESLREPVTNSEVEG